MDRDPEIYQMLKKTLIELPPGPVSREDFSKAKYYVIGEQYVCTKSKRKNYV